jgi:hypothetical protein
VLVSYNAPILVLGGIAGYFPGLPTSAFDLAYVVIALGLGLLGGTILGRSHPWRKHAIALTAVLWAVAAYFSVPMMLELKGDVENADDPFSSLLIALAPGIAAAGLTIGIAIGVRFMRAYSQGAEPPNTSLERTRGG